MANSRFFWCLLLIILPSALRGQLTPAIVNYKVGVYKAHTQNWSVTQDKDRRMYFANSDGLLTFDGNTWNLKKLKTNKIIRSVCAVGDRIYSGAYGEFGYWIQNGCNEMEYESLVPLIGNNAIDKEEIWNIITYGNKVYFQSFSVLMVYDGKSIHRIKLPGSIMYLHKVQNKLIVQALDFGLYEVNEDYSTTFLNGSSFFKGKIVTGISHFGGDSKDQLIISTNSHGLFTFNDKGIKKWNQTSEGYFAEIQINKMIVNTKGYIILGSIRDGVLIFNRTGELLFHVKSSNGLQNNTILSVFEDKDHNIWLGLDKGIALIRMNGNLLFYNDYSGILGSVYTSAVNDSILYVGTNQGVYYLDLKEKNVPGKDQNFSLVKGTQGQVWQLKNLETSVLCGHNEGTFLIKKDKATKISDVTGGWYVEFLIGNNQKNLIQGVYTGLCIFKYQTGGWQFSHRILGFNEPVKKIILSTNGDFWVTGPNTGITKLRTDEQYRQIISKEKLVLPDNMLGETNLDLNALQGKILINDSGKHYYYDGVKKEFVEDPYLNSFAPGYFIRSIDDHIWFRVYKDSVIVMHDSLSVNSFNLGLNQDYHCITGLDLHQFVFSLNEGLAVCNNIFDRVQPSETNPIRMELYFSNSGTCISADEQTKYKINYKDKRFGIRFFDYRFENGKTYQYRINPGSSGWISITDNAWLEFSNLNPGQHLIEIRSVGSLNSTKLKLKLLPPWYQSPWAMSFYVLILALGLLSLRKYFNKKLDEEKKKLESENSRLLREHKVQLENERLMHDNMIKAKELANVTMHLVQKNELLQEIKEELIDVRKTGDHTLTTRDFQNLMNLINQNMTVDDDKNLFESNFNEVHEQFLKKVKSDFPELSSADLRLAALIKMNLSSKEIAPLFNISLRGLENKRYRLRKKLSLPNDSNLFDFFNKYN